MSRKRSNVLAHLLRNAAVVPPRPAAPRNPWLGHNGGPQFDDLDFMPEIAPDDGASWRLFCWSKAHQEAWRTPPREVALRRLARAEAIGMTYRAYTAVILDTGRFL